MTFYWWSHWFWITVLSNILILNTFVETYPSQELSLEYNQNGKTVKTITKLYRTTVTSLQWATAIPPRDEISESSRNRTTPTATTTSTAQSSESLEDVDDNNKSALEVLENLTDELEQDQNMSSENSSQFEYKRSAEVFNKSIEAASKSSSDDKTKTVQESPNKKEAAGSVKLRREQSELNNYTNFSSAVNNLSTNFTNVKQDNNYNDNTTRSNSNEEHAAIVQQLILSSSSSSSSTSTTAVLSASASFASSSSSINSSATPTPSATAATPKSNRAHAPIEWLNAMAKLPSSRSLDSNIGTDEDDNDNDGDNNGDNSHGITAASTTTVLHKAPFTLENANKEDELRRAENEHRSRKSKVLSAEYKHINRFINFSTDSKNLLTRSASTAPNEYENDEGNISSEALAIQRTYFLDAGAISAICLTIFGICCTVGTIGIVLYRRRYLNKPQALSEPDSSVYIDDSTMRDNSDEMYSLDNDSFLNSLEAMTIQNYWTDTVKHTKL